jgi:hypothetical protein
MIPLPHAVKDIYMQLLDSIMPLVLQLGTASCVLHSLKQTAHHLPAAEQA